MILSQKKNSMDVFIFLPVLALCVDLFTPYLIWKNILPSEMRWVSHVALAAMLFISLFRIFGYNLIPLSFWMSAFITVLWSFVAIGHGQGIVSTIWGIWLFFQFPFVAIFIYLQPEPSRHLSENLRMLGLIIVGMVLCVQLMQFAFGVPPGDNLSGLFGEYGTAKLAIFDILVCCIFIGHWIASGQWGGLLAVLSMSMVSSVLGEMKIFPLSISLIGLIASILWNRKHRAPGKMLIYLVVIILIVTVFFALYNNTFPGVNAPPLQTYITDSTKVIKYLNISKNYYIDGKSYTNMGRLYAVNLGWTSLQKDLVTFLFGYGIGTRSESKTLGTTGVALLSGDVGLSVGTSLLVIMQEMGIIGLILLAFFLLWMLLALIRDIRAHPESVAVGLRYGLLLFSFLWPVWLFYTRIWTMRMPMLVYWFLMGYVFAESRVMRKQTQNEQYELIDTGGRNS